MSNNVFDYIVVGAGSAGCVVASRLTEDANVRVLLLEAGGPDTSVLIHAPAGVVGMVPTKLNVAGYETVPQPGLNNRRGYQPRGKVMGGSSSVNAMCYVRGNAWDYDHWAVLGNPGWSFKDVLPYFRKSEDNDTFDDEFHGKGGPQGVTLPSDASDLNQTFLQACANQGIPTIADCNGADQFGAFMYQRTIKDGERVSTAKTFITPHLGRPNLTVLTHALTERILVENGTATGVRVRLKDGVQDFIATAEVIVSAGAFGSPQLLMLSGIGPAAHLQQKGIAVVHDLPGVGRNLQDHIDYVMTYRIPSDTESFGLSLRGAVAVTKGILQWRNERRGIITSNFAESGAFFKSKPGLEIPDMQLIFIPAIVDDHARKFHLGHGYSCHLTLLRPRSRGSVTLVDSNPATAPAIDPGFLVEPEDLEDLARAGQMMRRILEDSAFDAIRGKLLYDVKADDLEDMKRDIRNRADTQYHPVGTCKMGPASDGMAVVDHALRVHGLRNLRVADGSIMPRLVGGNTNAPIIMIGEKLADMLRREH